MAWWREMIRWQLEPPLDWFWMFPHLALDLLIPRGVIATSDAKFEEEYHSYSQGDAWLRSTSKRTEMYRMGMGSGGGSIIQSVRCAAIQPKGFHWLVCDGCQQSQSSTLVTVEGECSSVPPRSCCFASVDGVPFFRFSSRLDCQADFTVNSFPQFVVMACPPENRLHLFFDCRSTEKVRMQSVDFDFSSFNQTVYVLTISAAGSYPDNDDHPWLLLVTHRLTPHHTLHWFRGNRLVRSLEDLGAWYTERHSELRLHLAHHFMTPDDNQLHLLFATEKPEEKDLPERTKDELIIIRVPVVLPDTNDPVVVLPVGIEFVHPLLNGLYYRLQITASWLWISAHHTHNSLVAIFRVQRTSPHRWLEVTPHFVGQPPRMDANQATNLSRQSIVTDEQLKGVHFMMDGLCVLRYSSFSAVCAFDTAHLTPS